MKALYVTERSAVGSDRVEAVLASLAGAEGLSVQLREKDASDRKVLARAIRARELLGSTPLYINRRFDLALAAGADGVHLPASGLPARRVRPNTPRGFRLGISTHSPAETAAAIEEGVELVVLGPIFETPSKRGYGEPLGPAVLSQLPASSTHSAEVYAIGGIDAENLEQLLPFRDRIAGIAAIRFFQETPDPRTAFDTVLNL